MPVPEMYMQKLIVPREAAGAIDLDAPWSDNIRRWRRPSAGGRASSRWWCSTGRATRT